MKNRILLFLALVFLFFSGCQPNEPDAFNVDENLGYCVTQATKTLEMIPQDSLMPRNIAPGEKEWKMVSIHDWTSGFWPGILWYLYEYTGEENWKNEAEKFSEYLYPLSRKSAADHDLGFQVFNSVGNGYRLTQNPEYKEVVLRTADTLTSLYNPVVGTIHSWPWQQRESGWPHNTIIDNMMNLELLFWASKNGGKKEWYDLAVRHAEVTMGNHFRDDYSSFHVVVYDTLTGEKIKGVTHQGYSDESLWARGHAWAIYGYTMTARETGNPEFLDFLEKIADVFLERLPEDMIPYWDFDAPDVPDAPRDAAAASIAASAFLELSNLVKDSEKSAYYRQSAEKILEELSSERYQSREANSAFLMHSTGSFPGNSEVDYSIIYADYYYLEALMQLKKLREGQSLSQ